MTVRALILADGKANRMGGGDKPLLEVGGSTMLSRIIAVLREDVAAIAISANGDPTRFAEFGLPVLPDGQFEGEGPLAGVLAGLEWARAYGAEGGRHAFHTTRPVRCAAAACCLSGELWACASPCRPLAG